MRIVLAMVLAAMFCSTGVLAQDCAGIPPGPAKKACLEANPRFLAKEEKCKQEATQQGLRRERGSSAQGEFIMACMQRR